MVYMCAPVAKSIKYFKGTEGYEVGSDFEEKNGEIFTVLTREDLVDHLSENY